MVHVYHVPLETPTITHRGIVNPRAHPTASHALLRAHVRNVKQISNLTGQTNASHAHKELFTAHQPSNANPVQQTAHHVHPLYTVCLVQPMYFWSTELVLLVPWEMITITLHGLAFTIVHKTVKVVQRSTHALSVQRILSLFPAESVKLAILQRFMIN